MTLDTKGTGRVVRPDHPVRPRALPPVDGPGSELRAIFESLGITPDATCGCKAMMRRMNRYGVAGCRRHRDGLLAFLRKTAAKKGWSEKWGASWRAVATGLAFQITWSDPLPDLLDLAIQRAETHAAAAPDSRASSSQSPHP